jgi:uncharacterized membrane protein
MFNSLPFALTFISALTCGLMAGFFFTFSAFVMNGLGRLAATRALPPCNFTSWMAWNQVRTAGALAAAASLTIALCLPHNEAAA